jgi:hypothetical protein
MKKFITDIQLTLDAELNQIDIEESDIITKAQKSIIVIESKISILKKFIEKHKFQSPQEEIHFFKEIKPSIFSKLIFFTKVFNIELRRPIGSINTQVKYYQNELQKIETFYFENIEFHSYIRNNMTEFDDKYFIRGQLDQRLYADICVCNIISDFATSHDNKLAHLLAFDLLAKYLNDQIIRIDRKEPVMAKTNLLKNKLQWTDLKTSLVELIYAIKYTGCINNGAITVNELTALFESLFNIDLTDSYRAYKNIKDRQQPTKFIEKMKTALINKVEEVF